VSLFSTLFTRSDPTTTRQTLQIFREELLHDKKSTRKFLVIIPIGHLLRFVALPLFISYLIQSLITHPHNIDTPIKLLVGIGLSMIGATICNDKGYTLLFNHEEYAQTRLLKRGLDHLMHQSYEFFANQRVGTLAGDLMNFSRAYMTALDTYFMSTNHLVVSFIVSLVVIAIIAPILLLPLLIIIGLILVTSARALSSRAPYRNKRKVLTSQLTGVIADVLGNEILVRVFTTEKHESDHIMQRRAAIEGLARKEIVVIERESRDRQIAVYTFQLITLVAFILLYAHAKLSVAGLIFSYTYLSRTTDAIFGIASLVRSFEQALLDAAPMTKILMQPSTLVDEPDAKTLVVHHGRIEIAEASFTYGDTDDAVFEGLSLSVQPGERIGLAGPSGGGKSTLTKLLLRFADLDSGKILVDGQDIRHVTQASLRSQIAYVPQEPFLFHRSLRENIAYGSEHATDEQILEAARRAHALEFIKKLPKGLDTTVGERGVKLSGGQRQRIAIARAILKDAPILILDEATSALDSESEKLIQSALWELMHGKTALIIAHRLSTIQRMDRIVVLDEGKIAEQGSHEALLSHNGLYAKLWQHQSGGFIES